MKSFFQSLLQCSCLRPNNDSCISAETASARGLSHSIHRYTTVPTTQINGTISFELEKSSDLNIKKVDLEGGGDIKPPYNSPLLSGADSSVEKETLILPEIPYTRNEEGGRSLLNNSANRRNSFSTIFALQLESKSAMGTLCNTNKKSAIIQSTLWSSGKQSDKLLSVNPRKITRSFSAPTLLI